MSYMEGKACIQQARVRLKPRHFAGAMENVQAMAVATTTLVIRLFCHNHTQFQRLALHWPLLHPGKKVLLNAT